VIVENAFTIVAPQWRVFDALLDLERLAPCLPAVRLDEVSSGGAAATGRLRLPLGRSSVSYRGTLRISGVDRKKGTVRMAVDAREVRGDGRLTATIDLRLREVDGATSASIRGTSDLSGRAAAVDPQVMRRAATALLNRFGAGLATSVTQGGRRAPRRTEPDGEGLEAAIRTLEDGERTTPPRIRGTVTVMTDGPIEMPAGTSMVDSARQEVEDHPWLVPALLVCALALALAFRRRND
jgi:carbon monoxide dehydrogenase subunit G